MKILAINTSTYGSTGRIMLDLQHAAVDEGYSYTVAFGRGNDPKEGDFIRIGSQAGIYAHALLSRITDRAGFYSRHSTVAFLKQIEKISPDIVHLHNVHGYILNLPLLFNFLKNSEVKVVWTLHDCWAYTGHCGYYDMVKCDKWKTECNHCPNKREYPQSLIWDSSKSNFEKKKELFSGYSNMQLVTPSTWLASQVKQSFLGDYPIEVIHNGINEDVFKYTESDIKSKLGIQGKKVILGIANVWSERKGLNDFISLSDYIDKDCVIVLVGLEKKQIRELPDNIVGLYKTSSMEELVKLYSCADVFFNPTYEENFPTVNLEAYFCGVPVITYRTGGSPETILGDGLVLRPRDFDSLINYLKNTDTNKANRKLQRNLFDCTARGCAEHYLGLYKRLG